MKRSAAQKRQALFKKTLSLALRMQPLFDAEPTYRTTGQGSMRSEGVGRQQRMKANARKLPPKALAR